MGRKGPSPHSSWIKHHRRRNYAVIAGVSVLLILIIVAVSSIRPPGVNVGQQAPDFSLRDITNETFQLEAVRGTPVLLEFMATSCGACANQAPILSQSYSSHGTHVKFVSIGINPATDQASVLSSYATSHNSPWIWIRDTSGISKTYGVTATPTIFILDRDHVVQSLFVGVTNLQTLDTACQAVM